METGFTIPTKKPPATLVTLENIIGPSASITQEQFTLNEREINEIRAQQQLCKNCQGIQCEQPIEGMVLSLPVSEGSSLTLYTDVPIPS
jgi:hypothetical protein